MLRIHKENESKQWNVKACILTGNNYGQKDLSGATAWLIGSCAYTLCMIIVSTAAFLPWSVVAIIRLQ
jgi:hypothetical protein